jgi:anti-sigma factor RsiW
MQEDLLNTLSESNKDIDNQKLMDYISGKLSAEQKHEVEKILAANPFLNEAVEGLQQADEVKTHQAVEQLNKQLRLHLQQRKRKRTKQILPVNTWTYVAVLVILMIAVIVFFVVRLSRS